MHARYVSISNAATDTTTAVLVRTRAGWGRGQEGVGEDPFLSGEWAFQYVKGLQEGEDPKHLKLLAVCKHFLAYDLESWGPEGCKPKQSCWKQRGDFNAVIPPDQITSYYLPAFKRCIRDAGAGGVMCSFNAVNSVPSVSN
jgi:beta-D-xylosidase 4